jgi:hypothetical protein
MKTTEFIEKVEAAGFYTLKQDISAIRYGPKPFEAVPVIFVCKDEENTIHVGEFEKWLLKSDYYKFAFLSDADKDTLMALAVEYIATDPENRI